MTHDSQVLSDLLRRVEEATGPDEELDLRLYAEFDDRDFRIVDHPKFGRQMLGRSRTPPHDECWLNHHSFARARKRYTASVDAALALVERVLPGWWLESMSDEVSAYQDGPTKLLGAAVELDHYGGNPIQGSASTRPLAILAALLRAILDKETVT